MRWRGCRIRSGGMQLHGIDVFVAGPGAIKTAIWTKPTATEPKFALEAHALGDLKPRDDTPPACRTFRQFRTFVGVPFAPHRGGKQIGRARQVPIEGGSAVFRGSPCLLYLLKPGHNAFIIVQYHDTIRASKRD
jgi:hypothetical protein